MKRILSVILTAVILMGLMLPVSVSASAPSRVEELLSGMTLRQKITQMLMVDFRYWDENLSDSTAATGFTVMNSQVSEIVEEYDFGAIIYFAQNLVGTEQSFNLTMAMQTAATNDGGIPMIISADQEGGSVYRLATGTALPGNMALGAASDTDYAKSAGEIIGRELAALGINTTLSPVVDVNNNPNNPVIGLRSYSDDAVTVGTLASAVIDGLKANNVIGCAKHFPGHGDTATDSHYGLPSVNKSLSVLKECELKPYEIAIEQGIDMIMTAHILYPQLESDTIVSNKTGRAESLPATMSDDIITNLLKGDMGFEGIVVTDAMNMAGISNNWDEVQSVVIAISAGADMICMPCTLYDVNDLDTLDSIIAGVETAVNNGTIPISRINDAVTRILTVKEKRGILDWNADDYSADYAKYTVGSELNRQAEREIAAAAVTVVQNKNNTLPLNVTSSTKVLMLVPYENESAQMIMGFNRAKKAGVIPEGAEAEVIRFSSSTVSSSVKASIGNADIVIINSEVSSASKMEGASWLSAFPIAAVSYAESLGKVTVVQSVDKPYDVQSYSAADAVLAVYGCKGSSVDVTEALVGGVTSSETAYGPNIIAGIEVMFGVFGARGTLPLDIPKYSNGSYGSTLVYARGTGITYAAKHIHCTSLTQATVPSSGIGLNEDIYECEGCGMWFEGKAASTVITNKFDYITDSGIAEDETVSPDEDQDGDGIPDSYNAYTDANGDYVFENADGYVFDIDYVNGVIGGEDATIITNSDYYSSCNPNWAISVELEPTGNSNEYSVVKVAVTPGSAENAGISWDSGDIVMVVHSASSQPGNYENWMSKVAAMALKQGDVVTVSSDFSTVTVAPAVMPDVVTAVMDSGVVFTLDIFTGDFILSESGSLADFSSDSSAPWCEYSNHIKTVYVNAEIEYIGAYAFADCKNLEKVYVPSRDTACDLNAFYGLESVNIFCHDGSSVKTCAEQNGLEFTVYGDLSNNKSLDTDDIALFRKAILIGSEYSLDISDMNFDGEFDLKDFVNAKKCLAQL